MAIESIGTGVGGVAGGGGTSPAAEVASFDRALASQGSGSSPGPATQVAAADPISRGSDTAGTRATGVQEASREVSATSQSSGDSLGHRILDRIGALQNGDASLRANRGGGIAPTNEPTLRVAARAPGPAEASPAAGASRSPEIAGSPTLQPGQSQNPGFDSMLNQLQRISGQVIQVSVVSKTTGSFTGALNKLISSG